MNNAVAIELKHVTKTFGHVVANYNVDLDVRNGEISPIQSVSILSPFIAQLIMYCI